VGQLKSALYARMEEVSFRAGAAVAGGVLTVPVGHRDAAAIAPARATPIAPARATPPSLALPPVAPGSSVPSPTPPSSRTTTRSTAAGTYQPPSAVRASAARGAATRQAASTSALGRTPTPRLREARSPRRPGMPPGYWRSHPPWPWLSALPWHHRRR
jgi:hypothetical protein